MALQEPVLNICDQIFYDYINQMETFYPVCHLYHYYKYFLFSEKTEITVFPESQVVKAGDNVVLKCEAQTDVSEASKLKIYWKRNGEKIDFDSPETSSTLSFNSMDNSLTISGQSERFLLLFPYLYSRINLPVIHNSIIEIFDLSTHFNQICTSLLCYIKKLNLQNLLSKKKMCYLNKMHGPLLTAYNNGCLLIVNCIMTEPLLHANRPLGEEKTGISMLWINYTACHFSCKRPKISRHFCKIPKNMQSSIPGETSYL